MERTLIGDARIATASTADGRVQRFTAALDRALAEAAEDERITTALVAIGIRMRFTFVDCGLTLNVAAGGEDDEATLRWSFDGDVDWQPRLELAMSVELANRYLQGYESLAIAIAHRQVRCSGEARCALRYLPATRLISEPYRRVIAAEFPDLLVD